MQILVYKSNDFVIDKFLVFAPSLPSRKQTVITCLLTVVAGFRHDLRLVLYLLPKVS